MGPLLGPLKPTGPMMGPTEAHGPSQVHRPRGHCPPLPPSHRPCLCFNTNLIPKLSRRVSIVTIIKPGKNVNSPTSCRSISLLCTPYQLLKQVILTQITPIIEFILPPQQVGFRRGRSSIDQVVRITEDIEEPFDMVQVTGAVFLDLTAAYDTVWLTGLHLKIQKPISFRKTTELIMNLLYHRSFVFFTGGKASKPSKLKNGVAQGSILAPTLYNIYTTDFPSTSCKRYMYAHC